MITAEAVTRQATWGTGAQRQQQQAALVGVSDTVDPQPRSPDALAARLVAPDAAGARRRGAAPRDDAPSAQQGRRVARLVRTNQQVMALSKAAAERRDPPPRHPWVRRLEGALGLWRLAPRRCTPCKRVTWVLDLLPGVGSRWAAAHAWVGDASQVGTRWGQRQLTAMRRGRGGAVSGGRRHIRTNQRRRPSGRQTRATVSTCVHHHRRWRPSDQSLARGLPVGTGVVESACGSVVTPRMEGEGQRWSRAGAEAMLAWRWLTKSHADDLRDDWRFHARQVRLRLYGRQPQYRSTARFKHVASLNSKRLRSNDDVFLHHGTCGRRHLEQH